MASRLSANENTRKMSVLILAVREQVKLYARGQHHAALVAVALRDGLLTIHIWMARLLPSQHIQSSMTSSVCRSCANPASTAPRNFQHAPS